ncbi:DIS3-like exonuclease 2 isoform X3 [Schistocerca nitens]|uniref:DIS3-like exonuclease 2 isoform X2 n=1 Tax=Schistocerca nitens TaxID=7011 RepID=UPI002118D3AD|nr:DIS3-like exonuclease 2 isoform X2 [Schistocerca nitens]XP_049808404.1 DIS3-like exonuclease 2 isoform X3 [Schistocerca nitens]
MGEDMGVIPVDTSDFPEITETVSDVMKELTVTETDNITVQAEDLINVGVSCLEEAEGDIVCTEEKRKKRHRIRKRKPKNKTDTGSESKTVNVMGENMGVIPVDSRDFPEITETVSDVTKELTVTETDNITVQAEDLINVGVSCLEEAEGDIVCTEEKRKKRHRIRKRKPKNKTDTGSESGHNGSPRKTTNKAQGFEKYLPQREIEEGLQNGTLIKGIIRINQRNYKESYISNPDGQMDIFISGVQKRNRALEGDEVVVKLEQSSEWKLQSNGCYQKTGKVVFISVRNHLKVAVGTLKKMGDENSHCALFSPRDARIPRMKIPLYGCPLEFLVYPEKFKNIIILAKMVEWSNVNYALGEIIQLVGEVGNKEAETTGILLEHGLDVTPYSDDMKGYFPQAPYHISEEEIQKRVDLRKECIFTIDPKTAKDLDDAVSCKLLENGNFEIGVHISDVTHFLTAETPLDDIVSKKATSVYLVDAVHHMLPKELCMLCSLLPGEDKLTYSVIWEMTPNAEILSQHLTRSVINSCSQLAYEHVQAMIENPDKQWTKEDLPPLAGGFEPKDILSRVLWLHKLALILRKRRFDGGALKIDQTKVFFSLDELGLPVAYNCYVQNDSHRLIEEFMLLANMCVARQLHIDHPQLAFLRCHPGPVTLMLSKVKATFEKRGIHLDVSSAGALQTSMWRYSGDDFVSRARMMVISSLCARAMSRAKYFCSGFVQDEDDYNHYALNVARYTHFTSPIRRYADVMVHRLLGASLGYHDTPKWTKEFVQRIALNCNNKKYAAKLAGEESVKLFLYLYLKINGPLEDDAVVIDVKDHSFDAVVCSNGLTQRVYVDKLDADVEFESQKDFSFLKIAWKSSKNLNNIFCQVIEIFSLVRVRLTAAKEQTKILAELIDPQNANTNNVSNVDGCLT